MRTPNAVKPGTASRHPDRGASAGATPVAAGAVVPGEPVAGEPVAGEPVAGEPAPTGTVPGGPDGPGDAAGSAVTGTPPKPRVSAGRQYRSNSSSAPNETTAPMMSGR